MKGMYKHLLIPTDGSQRSHAAAVHAIALAKQLNCWVTGLSVIITSGVPTRDSEAVDRAQAWLSVIAAEAEAAGVSCSTVMLRQERASEAIVHAAETMGCDLIVMASPGPERAAGMHGSETEGVLAYSRIPVLIHRLREASAKPSRA